MQADRKVSELEITQFAESMGCLYLPVSVKTDQGIEELISTIIDKSMDL